MGKKKEALPYLENQDEALLSEKDLNIATRNENADKIKGKFWSGGDINNSDAHVQLRMIQEKDRLKFIELQKEVYIMRFMLQDEEYQDMMWNEYIHGRSMMFTIEADGEYAGYCGINNVFQENWEIAIELLKKFRQQGIGYTAIKIMLSEIKARLGVDKFRVKIAYDNYASQRLFEKLGATPYGIAEYMLHKEDDIARYEKKIIDERFVQMAEKFGVVPRKLLSHALEYELEW